MKAAPTLLQRWEDALVFRIGDNDLGQLDQIPYPLAFPDRLPTKSKSAPFALGQVLAVGLLKLYRPWPVTDGEVIEFDASGGWLGDFFDLAGLVGRKGDGAELARRIRGYSEYLWVGFFASLGTLIEMALLAPDRLADLIECIDAIDNATLHCWAMRAVQGQADDFDFFKWLYR